MSSAAGFRFDAVRLIAVAAWACGLVYGGRAFAPGPDAKVVPGELIVRVESGTDIRTVVRAVAPEAYVARSGALNTHLVKFSGAVPQARIDALAKHPGVRFVEQNQIRTIDLSTPNDPSFGTQWALATVRAVDAWSVIPGAWAVPGGARVRVASLDTGIDCTHPDFAGPSGSVDSAAGGQINMSLSRAFVATTAPGAACPFQDDHGHGTHTAGTIAATTQNGAGVASLGFPLEIVAEKVLDARGSGTDFDIANAIDYAADSGVQVISMSLAGAGYSQVLQDAVDYAWARNVLVVAAAGNSNSSALYYPGDAFHVVGVAATDSANAKASFSNFGRAISIAAPGVSILSLYPLWLNASGMATGSGTSMSTPHVSALAGLVAMTTPGADADSLMRRIQQSAPGSVWTSTLGYGVIDAYRAVTGAAPHATTGSVVARVVDAKGLPIASATVTVAGVVATTDAAGVARCANIAPGTQTVTYAASGYASASATIAVVAGADSMILLKEGVATGTVQGAVTAVGLPVAGASVAASSNGVMAGSAVTDASGSYSLALPEGTFQVTASALGYRASAPSAATVTANTATGVDLAMVKIGRVVGTAKDSAGTAISGATLTLAGPQITVATSDATGGFASVGVASGQYTATCGAAGQRAPASTTLTVVDGADTAFDCVFPLLTVAVSPASLNAGAGQKVQFTATIDGVATSAVTWTRSPAIGTLSNGGLFTAPTTTNGETVIVTATSTAYPTRSGSATMQFAISSVLSVVLSPSKVTGGGSSTGNKIRLASAAPAGGVTVTLTSSDGSASVPATVVVPGGATDSPTFTIATTPVAADTAAIITANYNGATASATMTVLRPVLSSISLSPSLTGGGNTTTANRVTLSGKAPAAGIAVSLSSANSGLASVPASVVVPAGATYVTFSITTAAPAQQTTVQISAVDGAATKSATLTVDPVMVSSLTLGAATIKSGLTTTTNKVTLNAPAPSGGAGVLVSASPTVTAPATVNVPQGSTSATFSITAAPVDASTPFTVSASYGPGTKTVSSSVEPATLSGLSVSPASAVGGTTVTVTATLAGAAGPSGVAVPLTNSAPGVAPAPASVSVAPGATNGKATFVATAVSASTPVTLTATFGPVTKSTTHTVVAPDVNLVSITPSIKGGASTTTNRVRLNGVAPAGGTAVTLTSANPAVAAVPASVTVAAGQTYSPYFTIATQPVAANTSVVITATTTAKSATATLTVTP